MARHHIAIGRIFGISIGLDYSWFLIFILFTWSLAVGYYPSAYPAWPRTEDWLLGAVTAVLLFGSVLLHELGHAVVALRYKVPVLRITLFIFGGVAQIGAEPPDAAAEFWIAIAGPLVSGALAAIFAVLQPLAVTADPVLALLRYLTYINGALAVFNLVPGFPLDGGRILRAILWTSTRSFRRATLIAATVGRMIGFLFILWGVWQILGGRFGNGVWIAFIGWFLESAATAQVHQQQVESRLAGHTAAEAMDRHYTVIPGTMSLQNLVDHHVLGAGHRCLVVMRGEDAAGLVTVHQIAAVSKDRWPTTTAEEAMTPLARAKRLRPDTGLWAAIKAMDHDGVNQLPVTEDGRLRGMLTRAGVISFLRTLGDLGV